MSDPVSPGDVEAYIDGQLAPAARLCVQDYLSRHPDLAARVMADLRSREELRLACREIAPPSAALMATATRLERRLAARRLAAGAWRGIAAVLLVGLGWVLHFEVSRMQIGRGEDGAPPFVADARHAYRTELMRAEMASQARMPRYDPGEILEKTQIAMPKLSPGWQITDVQVFPTREGHSIEAMISAGALGTVSLFATRAERSATIPPQVSTAGSETAIYWQTGRLEYALIGTGSAGSLTSAARAMFGQTN